MQQALPPNACYPWSLNAVCPIDWLIDGNAQTQGVLCATLVSRNMLAYRLLGDHSLGDENIHETL